MAKILFMILVFNIIYNTQALKCYTCTVSESDFDQRCVTDPEQVESGSAITNCNKNYCTSTRQEYIDPKGKVASMERGCVDKPLVLNGINEAGLYRTYYRSCQEDLCNGGSGKDVSGGGLNTQKDGVGVLYVPGIGSNTTNVIKPTMFAIFLIQLYIFIIARFY